MRLNQLVLGSLASLVACGGPARPRVTEVTTIDDSGDSAVTTIDYSGSKVEKVTFSMAGTVNYVAAVEYDGSKISSITWTQPDVADYSVVAKIEYDGSKLAKIEETETDPNGTAVEITKITYEGSRVTKVVNSDSGGDTVTTELKYENSLLKRVTSTYTTGGSSEISIQDFKYDKLDMVEQIKDTSGGNAVVALFEYDKDDRLDTVVGGATYTLDYDKDGRVDQASRAGNNSWVTTYDYDDGDAEGLVINPDIAYGGYFDLEGMLLDLGKTESYVTSTLLLGF